MSTHFNEQGRPRPAFAGTIQGPADLSSKKLRDYLDASAEVGEIPPTVCIRHGKYLPCRNGYTNDDCLKTQHPAMARLVAAYQRDPDAVRWDFEHVVKSWLYMQKGEGNW